MEGYNVAIRIRIYRFDFLLFHHEFMRFTSHYFSFASLGVCMIKEVLLQQKTIKQLIKVFKFRKTHNSRINR